jgi:hypothetical protein
MLNRVSIFSLDRLYRYTLWREWGPPIGFFSHINPRFGKFVQFIGLNPSTADERTDDPTLRRCIYFAQNWGFGAMCMTNLFAYRSTDPRVLREVEDPVGPDNLDWILRVAGDAGIVVAGWGTFGTWHNQAKKVKAALQKEKIPLFCLSLTAEGEPGHPLYLPKGLRPVQME